MIVYNLLNFVMISLELKLKFIYFLIGSFIACWLPFFVVNLLTGLCVDCIAHEEIVSAVVNWLGKFELEFLYGNGHENQRGYHIHSMLIVI